MSVYSARVHVVRYWSRVCARTEFVVPFRHFSEKPLGGCELVLEFRRRVVHLSAQGIGDFQLGLYFRPGPAPLVCVRECVCVRGRGGRERER